MNASSLLVTALLLSSCLSQGLQEEGALPPLRSGEPPSYKEPLDEMMRGFIARHRVPGAALAVARDGELVYSRGFGLADRESGELVQADALFRIASISKPITAVAILQLVEDGELSLDENPFVRIGLGAELEVEGRDEGLRQITVRHLLSHRGGWDRDALLSFDPMFQARRIREELDLPGPPETGDIIRFMLGVPLDFNPGEEYVYSNFGYCVLGRVIEAVTGEPYEQAVRARVLAPLGIKDMQIGRSLPEERAEGEVVYHDQKQRTSAAVKAPGREVPIGYAHDQEVMDAHGAWIASAADLARFAGAFSDPSTCPLLREESIREMWAPQEEEHGAVWYGLGWLVRDVGGERRNAWHNGLLTGGTSTIMVRRHDGFSWAVLFNTDRSATSGKFLAGIVDPLVHRAVDQVERWPGR